MKCDRCSGEANPFVMSMFNMDLICMNCKEKEENDPNYEKAVKADINAIKKGNYNYEGIGL